MAGLFYEDVLEGLSKAGVPFVVVGGVAVNLQGVPRFTADLDVAVALDRPSLESAERVLSGLGLKARLPARDEDLRNPDVVRSWIAERNLKALTFADPLEPLREVDVVVDSPVAFDELSRSADRLTMGSITVAVASIDALIRMKEGTGRAQDASDVDALRRVKEALRGS